MAAILLAVFLVLPWICLYRAWIWIWIALLATCASARSVGHGVSFGGLSAFSLSIFECWGAPIVKHRCLSGVLGVPWILHTALWQLPFWGRESLEAVRSDWIQFCSGRLPSFRLLRLVVIWTCCCRMGEAAVPGPDPVPASHAWTLGVCNPAGLVGKAHLIPPTADVWVACETHLKDFFFAFGVGSCNRGWLLKASSSSPHHQTLLLLIILLHHHHHHPSPSP